MRKTTYIGALAILLLQHPFSVISQPKVKVGKMTAKELAVTCPFDSSAGAFYILDYGVTSIASDYNVVLRHTVRLKILDKSEFERANISLTHHPSSPIGKFKGFTYNLEGGKVEIKEVKKENIFKEKVNDSRANFKVTFPGVREGSVIEYSYEARYGNYNSLNTWAFQTSIPVLKSEYHVIIPQYLDYQRLMTGYIGLDVANVYTENGLFGQDPISNTHHHYLATNVPAFKAESYSPAKTDIISKIDFELRSIAIPGGWQETFLPTTYGELAQELMESDYWSKDISGAPWARETLGELLEDGDNSKADAIRIFEHIRSFDKAEERSLTLRGAFKKKSATDSEKNRMLVAMLRQAGYAAKPVRISTRAHGKVHPFYPMKRHFNFTVVQLKLGDEEFLLDATETEHEFGVLPTYCLNGKGLVIHKGPEEWVELSPFSKNGRITQAILELDEEGYLNGTIKVRRTGYDSRKFLKDMEKKGNEEYKTTFSDAHSDWSIASHEVTEIDAFSNEEVIHAELEGNTEDLGSVLYLNAMVNVDDEKNPFNEKERTFPIEYKWPFKDTYIARVKIPEGFYVESLPQPIRVALPERAGSLLFSVSQQENEVVINQQLQIRKTTYSIEEYPYLREFYAQLIEKNKEQIVLKRQ